ncbi:RimK/LysX family protein [Methanosarcina sp. UBA411]|jgi:predicted metalloprotease|uniref:putative ATP-dependent zinc protease n=1 Tax=Methanosarcina sp. UBA411 TaxID=1915589 RepID=UPI0025E47B04|nr:RimK/LysX family protein [Methanosarcina sp. UBA411]
MDAEEIRTIFKFSALEKNMISSFGIEEELFLPFLLSLKSGGSWSYASEETKSIAVKDVITFYDDENKIGYTLEKIYFFVDPKVVKEEGLVSRLEKCGTKEERELVERPYFITLQAKKIIFAEVNPSLKKITVRELKKKHIQLKGTPAYSAAHELEHLEKGEVKGIPIWIFEYVKEQ